MLSVSCAFVESWYFGKSWKMFVWIRMIYDVKLWLQILDSACCRRGKARLVCGQTHPWSDQGWICQGTGYADQAARPQLPKAKLAEGKFIWPSRWLGKLQMREKEGELLPCLCNSLVVWNFVHSVVTLTSPPEFQGSFILNFSQLARW